MPLFFIHGVNTRAGTGYETRKARRDLYLQTLFLDRLAQKHARFAGLEIFNIYWGDLGANARWQNASIPPNRRTDDGTVSYYGTDAGVPNSTGYSQTESLITSSGQQDDDSDLEALGVTEGVLLQATKHDIQPLLEAAFAQFIYTSEEMSLAKGESAVVRGRIEACLGIAFDQVSQDTHVLKRLRAATSDQQVIDLLSSSIENRYRELVRTTVQGSESESSEDEGLEALGGERSIRPIGAVREALARLARQPARRISELAVNMARLSTHEKYSNFLGDLCVYLQTRGTAESPGPIVNRILNEIRQRTKSATSNESVEPLIIITHSMGGNILYDILTHYDPCLHVDIWISVGGQVGLLEEIKVFMASDPSIGLGDRVALLRPQVTCWLNVYDPVDVLSFLAGPIFSDVNADVEYSTGAGILAAHGDYFAYPRFYNIILKEVEHCLR